MPTEPNATIEILNRPPTTLQDALGTDINMVHEASYVPATKALYRELWAERNTIEALVKHHLGLGGRDTCTVAKPLQWKRGSFNVCVPVEVRSPGSCRKLVLRCAMRHKLAEAHNPGSVDEIMGCEVGAYVWIHERCPSIRIPHLYGFGFSGHRTFTHAAHLPPSLRVWHRLKRLLYKLIGHPSLLSHYTRHPAAPALTTAYMLLEDVGSDTSRMLAHVWNQGRGDVGRRQTLFRGLAQAMLSLARVPQPRIGSFRFHDDGTISLTNRPLNGSMMILENDGSPKTIQRDDTYHCTEPFVADLFHFHDQRFLTHPNAVYTRLGCRSEMASKVLMRALAHRYIRQDRRNGPFFLQFTDLHIGNVFVDDDWNITCLIDLEWVCALPVERLAVPYWLTGRAIDDLLGERLVEFNHVRQEFMEIFGEEEGKMAAEHDLSLAQVMREGWISGGVWFWYAILSINAMYSLWTDHLCPRFFSPLLATEEETLSRFWTEDAAKVVDDKIRDYGAYEAELRGLFKPGRQLQL